MGEHCLGITKNGEPCRVTANLVDGYCRIHRSMRDDAPSRGGGTGGGEPDVVLERAPETGHPRYVSCAEEPRRRWGLIAVVTVVALLALALAVFLRPKPKSK